MFSTTVMVYIDCQLGRIYSHLGDKPLGRAVRTDLKLIDRGPNLKVGGTILWAV